MMYVLMVMPNPGVTPKQIQDGPLSAAHSWFRLSPNFWVVCSSQTAAFWAQQVRPWVAPQGTAFIDQLDIHNRSGWMTKKFWDWYGEHSAHHV